MTRIPSWLGTDELSSVGMVWMTPGQLLCHYLAMAACVFLFSIASSFWFLCVEYLTLKLWNNSLSVFLFYGWLVTLICKCHLNIDDTHKDILSNRWWHKGGPYFTECWITVTKATLFSCSSWNCTVWAPQVCFNCIHDLPDCPLLCNFFQGQPTNVPHCLMVGSFGPHGDWMFCMWLS